MSHIYFICYSKRENVLLEMMLIDLYAIIMYKRNSFPNIIFVMLLIKFTILLT